MSYGRNFEFRIAPVGGHRAGRYAIGATALPIGAPIAAGGTFNTLGLEVCALSATATPPVVGRHGILVYEHKNAEAFAGDDTNLVTYADKGDAPALAAVQMVNGNEVKVVLKNTVDRTFLHTRAYTGRKFVAGLGATLTLAVGDYLEPATTPSAVNGYWQETATKANAWLVITKVDNTRGEVEARLMF